MANNRVAANWVAAGQMREQMDSGSTGNRQRVTPRIGDSANPLKTVEIAGVGRGLLAGAAGRVAITPQTKSILKIASFTLLLVGAALVGEVKVLGNPVPITLQTAVLMAAGLTLNWREAGSVAVAYLLAGAAGFPVFAGGASTAALLGPSAGWLFGFVPGIVITSLIGRSKKSMSTQSSWGIAINSLRALAATLLGCVGVVYLFGIVAQATVLHLPIGAVAAAAAAFLPGDLLKVAVVCVIYASWFAGKRGRKKRA